MIWRLQKIVSRLVTLGVVITQEYLNSKFLRSLPPEWNTYVVVWMNKVDIEIMSIDDFTSSTNDVNTANPAYEVSTVSPNINTACPQTLEQIHEDDMEVMTLKWQLSLLSMRAKRYFQRIRKKIFINATDTAGYDKSKVKCFNCHNMGYFARECRAPRNKEGQYQNQDNTRKQGNNEDTSSKAMLAIDGCDDLIVKLNQTEFTAATYKKGLATIEEQLITYRKNGVLFSKEVAVLKREVACKDYEINVLKSEFEKVNQEKEGIEFKIQKFDKASKDLDKLLGSQITNKSKKGLGYNAVPPPHALIYNRPKKLDLSYSGLDEFKEPEFKAYGSEVKQVSKDTSRFVESLLIVDKETVFPADKKEVDINKKTENQAKMTKLSMEWKRLCKIKAKGVDNRRITLIVIRARANSAVVVSLMEFVLVVLMEMEIKSIFQLRTLLINLQFIYPEPDYSLDFNSPQDLHNLQQQNLCCENCRGPHATIECQPMSQNSHSFGFDQLQTPQFSVNHQPPQPMSMEALQAQEDLMKSIESFLKKFNRISFGKTPKVLLQAWDNFFEVKHAQSEEVQELLSKLVQDVKIISDELSEYINTPAWNRPLVYCDNDDDEDYTIAITPESPTKEPVNSLSLGDEHLDTIPATESDEFIKSSVENLVPTPIEFEDFSDDECDLPPYDDSSKNHDFTFSNPLFDIDEDFTLSDESFSEEDIPKENFIIFSNPLFDLDEEIASTKVDRINDEVLEGIHSIPPGIDSFDAESDLVESVLNRDISIDSSPKIDSLSNEFAGELILPKSIPPEIEEVEFDPEGDILFLESLLYDNSSPRPPEALQANSNAIESLPPSHIPVADNDSLMEEIDLFLADDGSIPPGIESDDVDSVDDDTSISLPEFESFYVDYPNSGNSTIDVVEDIPVDVPNVLPTHPILEQDFIPTSEFFAYVVWIFLPFLAYPVIPPSLLSCGDEDTIFDPGISKDCPDCEDSQFCHSSRVSHPQLQLGIRYPNLID
ncbi:putative ribonuclease H-like domain-containing protein [Tanacetum coccineum]